MIKWFKYVVIRAVSTVANKTVVNIFGDTYIVYGAVVQRITK